MIAADYPCAAQWYTLNGTNILLPIIAATAVFAISWLHRVYNRRKTEAEFLSEIIARRLNAVFGFFRRIFRREKTAHQNVEEELRKVIEKQRLFIEQSSMALIEWDNLFRLTHWNPAAERIFGYKAEEAIGQYVTFLVPPGDQADLKRILMGLILKQDRLSSTIKNRTKDGKTIVCRWYNTPLTDKAGKFLGAVSLCEEITEYKKMEEELERLAAVVRNCSELVNIATIEGNMIFLNESGCKMLGINSHDTSMYSLTDFIADGAMKEQFEKDILPILLRGETWRGEMQYRNRMTGKNVDVQATIFGILAPAANKPLYVANISLDITERKQAEAALREKDRKLQLFLENTSDMIWTINFSGKATYVSPSVANLLGYTPEEFSRFTFKDYMKPASAQFAMNRLLQAIADNQPGKILEADTFEIEYIRKDGSLLWTEVHTNGIYDDQGHLIGVQGTTRDISNRKKSEKLLRESERRHRLFAENANGILCEFDFSGRYTYISPSVIKVLGYSQEEAMQFHVGDAMTAESAEAAYKCFAEVADAVNKGRFVPAGYFESEVIRKDGAIIWVGLHYSIMCNESGKPIGMQGIAIDITERKRVETELAFKNVLMSTLQEVSIDGMLVVDSNRKVLLRNQRFNEMWRLSPQVSATEDDVAVLNTGLVNVADPDAFLEKVLYLYEHREESSRDEITMKDGRIFDRYSAPMFGPDGQYYGRVWFFRDIIDRK
jgi:PAS domain S-box-containing protein